jgi:thioesterase domain-containing protein
VAGGKPHTRIEEMAAAYIEELREAQPEGPYQLGGFCSGAYVALEMAHQLQQSGERVSLLVSFDTDGKWKSIHSISGGIGYHWGNLRQMGNRGRLEYVLGRFRYRAARVRNAILHTFCRTYLALGRQLPLSLLLPYIEELNRQAVCLYEPRRFHGALVYFQGDEERFRDPRPFWGGLVSEIKSELVPGRGIGIFHEPHVRVLAERLSARLREAGG